MKIFKEDRLQIVVVAKKIYDINGLNYRNYIHTYVLYQYSPGGFSILNNKEHYNKKMSIAPNEKSLIIKLRVSVEWYL